jgi:hypothetical protein
MPTHSYGETRHDDPHDDWSANPIPSIRGYVYAVPRDTRGLDPVRDTGAASNDHTALSHVDYLNRLVSR